MRIIRNKKSLFVDARGAITNLLDEGVVIKSILLTSSVSGAIRANHYHKKDAHYVYLVSGKMEWRERSAGDMGEGVTEILQPGDMVFTPPMTEHASCALAPSVFLAFATEPRSREEYEADTVRVSLIEEKA
ncbi:MAG: cupin domain-containing protein [bacterium]|nr:cupin domain-containing protein [bacterium]MDZ4299522.1 cupin domain-containing protein [Candidatus Sungbacteria bacterium]